MYIEYRQIRDHEHAFLKEMLYEALFVPKGKPKLPETIIEHPEIKKYIEHWNQQKGDLAIVAVHQDKLVGAVWGRQFPVHHKGYGYINEHTPEISIAVTESLRGLGIGTQLLRHIEIEYLKIGVGRISLSVDKHNPALSLYKSSGYRIYKEDGTSLTMVKNIQ